MAQRTKNVHRLALLLLLGAFILAVGFGAGSIVGRLSQSVGLVPTASADAVPNLPYSTWDQGQDPNYYRVIGKAQVINQPKAGTVEYGPMDFLGRATGATATITYETMQKGLKRSRGETGELTPSGWGHNREVDIAMPDGTVYHGFLFNRSHLIAKSLGGDDELHNLIMGTRTQNVGANIKGSDGGMAYAESIARSWLSEHPEGTLYYAANPAYEGAEPVARSVIIDMKSSDGTIDQRIEVFNTARGFEIDYATGEFEVTEDAYSAAHEISTSLGFVSHDPSYGAVAEETESTDEAPATEEPVATGEVPATEEPMTTGEATPAEPSTSEETTDTSSAANAANAADADTVTPTGTPESENGERKVIITGSGEAYHHDETCSGLEHARSMEWVTVSEAESMGRHPCGICGG